MIRVGDVEIDLTGSQKEVDAEMMNIREGEEWSTAIAKVRSARETAIAAAVEAAKKSGMPERGSAFRSLIENSSLTKKPDQVLAAIQYLREVEGLDDSPPRVLKELFEDSGLTSPCSPRPAFGCLRGYNGRDWSRCGPFIPIIHWP